MPSLSVRAMAELINLPTYEQLRILNEQKYPKSQPQSFRTPFYQPALNAIRDFYRQGQNLAVLARARQDLQSLGLEARRENNLRVIDRFEGSNQVNRNLLPRPNPRVAISLGNVELRLSVDICASEDGESKFVYYNCRNASVDAELARSTLEIAHWVLEEDGVDVDTSALGFIDLNVRRIYRISTRRRRTLTRMRKNVRVIEALWPTI